VKSPGFFFLLSGLAHPGRPTYPFDALLQLAAKDPIRHQLVNLIQFFPIGYRWICIGYFQNGCQFSRNGCPTLGKKIYLPLTSRGLQMGMELNPLFFFGNEDYPCRSIFASHPDICMIIHRSQFEFN